jgi:hypothetical protein
MQSYARFEAECPAIFAFRLLQQRAQSPRRPDLARRQMTYGLGSWRLPEDPPQRKLTRMILSYLDEQIQVCRQTAVSVLSLK